MSPSPTSASMEQTLAVFYSTSPFIIDQLKHHLSAEDVSLNAQAEFDNEELEEAGLEPGQDGEEVKHWTVVLQGEDAVKKTKELMYGNGSGSASLASNQRTEALSTLFPDLKMHCSPSIAAANMSIATLFPRLGHATSPSSSSVIPASAPTPPKPFALSNAAHPAPLVLNTKAAERQTSPSIERALKELERQEERRRTSSGGSSVSRRSFGRSEVQDDDLNEEAQDRERSKEGKRVFNARSAENTSEFEVFPSVEDASDAQEETEIPTELLKDEDARSAVSEPSCTPLARPASSTSLTSAVSSAASRPRPSSVIQPRMTKAAALRLGIPYVPQPRRQSSISSLPTSASTTSVERVIPTPKSLAAPSITPRQTKASALRLRDGSTAIIAQQPTLRRETIGTAERAALDKQRRASLAVGMEEKDKPPTSTRPEVKMSRAALLRQGIEVPQTAAERRQSSVGSSTSLEENVKPAGAVSRRQSLSGAIRSTAPPKIAPRPTRSSALRSGVDSPSLSRHGKAASTLEDLREESDAPDVAAERRESSAVSSTAPPKFPVRVNKSSSLRLGQPLPATGSRPPLSRASSSQSSGAFEGVPGHKRRETIAVASTAQPKIAPRMSRTSMLRAGMEVEQSAAIMRRQSMSAVKAESAPAPPRRRESIAVASLSKPPPITPRLNRSTLLRQGSSTPGVDSSDSTSPTLTRKAALPPTLPHASSNRSSSALSSISNHPRVAHSSTESAPAALPSTASSNGQSRKVINSIPSITPRSNKSAQLRAAKLEADSKLKKGAAGGPPALVKVMGKGRPSTALGLTKARVVKSSGEGENVESG